MIFIHDPASIREGRFVFFGEQTAMAHESLCKELFAELWLGYSYRTSSLKTEPTDQLCFTLGNASPIALEGASYAINVTSDGVYVAAPDTRDLIYGYLTLIDMIKMSDDGKALYIDCCELRESPKVKDRMVHFCVFHDVELWELERFVRLCGALKFSHLIVEFWGMFKYDCLDALSWREAYKKDELKRIFADANTMGLQIIPMFNHWGHAASGRVRHGKHVVLDQAPQLQYLFDDTGWIWNFKSEKVRELFRQVRSELIEVCGEGEYFHIGCDEAYGFGFSKQEMDDICTYINSVKDELAAVGRRTVMWGDMLLAKHPEYDEKNCYCTLCRDLECEKYMLEHISKDIIIGDWQYDCRKYPVETAVMLKNNGFKVLLCPWDRSRLGSRACMDTVKREGLEGIMHTTWHTLSKGMPFVGGTAISCWSDRTFIEDATRTASVLRKLRFADGDYTKSGWGKYEIDVLCT